MSKRQMIVRNVRTAAQRGKPFIWSKRGGFTPAKSLAGCGAVYWQAARAILPTIPSAFEAYPVVFLYRHAMEAYIKAILCDFGSEIGIGEAEVRERGHDLCKQLPDLLRVSQLVELPTSRVTESAINQFNGTDPHADRFRYDDDLPKNQTFDVGHFAGEADSVLEELSNLYDELADRAARRIKRQEGIAD